MKIETGDLEIYSSGTIISIPNESVKFFVEDLLFEFRFVNDKEKISETNITAEVINEGKGIALIFKNFNNSLGTGNSKILPVGKVNGRDLFLNYRIHA